jgi:hypothetical protein
MLMLFIIFTFYNPKIFTILKNEVINMLKSLPFKNYFFCVNEFALSRK